MWLLADPSQWSLSHSIIRSFSFLIYFSIFFFFPLPLSLQIGTLFAPGCALWNGLGWEDFPGLQNFEGSVMAVALTLDNVSGEGKEKRSFT